MDVMEEYELQDTIQNLKYIDKDAWERLRIQIYSNVQMNTKKKLKPEDILKFPWEQEDKPKDTSISNEDISRLREKAQQISQNINNAK